MYQLSYQQNKTNMFTYFPCLNPTSKTWYVGEMKNISKNAVAFLNKNQQGRKKNVEKRLCNIEK